MKNGAWAASGKVIPELLEKLLSLQFFSLPPPKSTGREIFNLAWLESCLSGDEKPADVQATLLQLTIRGISESVFTYFPNAAEIYLCGGGARNGALIARLRSVLCGKKVELTDRLGVDADWLEAFAFAWLAQRAILGFPGNPRMARCASHAKANASSQSASTPSLSVNSTFLPHSIDRNPATSIPLRAPPPHK